MACICEGVPCANYHPVPSGFQCNAVFLVVCSISVSPTNKPERNIDPKFTWVLQNKPRDKLFCFWPTLSPDDSVGPDLATNTGWSNHCPPRWHTTWTSEPLMAGAAPFYGSWRCLLPGSQNSRLYKYFSQVTLLESLPKSVSTCKHTHTCTPSPPSLSLTFHDQVTAIMKERKMDTVFAVSL